MVRKRIKKIYIAIVVSVIVISAVIFIGCSAGKKQLSAPTGLRIEDDVLTWNSVNGAVEYVVTVDDKEYTTSDTSFDLFYATGVGSHKLRVQAYGDLEKNLDSLFSAEMNYTMELNLNGVGLVENADNSGYSVGATDPKKVSGLIRIPRAYKGTPITGIIENGFRGCEKLEKIYIPDSITNIGRNAFRDCTALQKVRLSKSLTNIPQLFVGCTSLRNIEIPASVTSITNRFEGCTALENITIEEGNKVYKQDRGCIIKDNEILVTGVNIYGIPDYVTSILPAAFSGLRGIGRVTIPTGVTTISASAFSYSDVESVVLHSGVTQIGDSAFLNCKSLTEIYLPEGLSAIRNAAFSGCASLAEINLPKSLSVIMGAAFKDCTSLAEINLPESLSVIDYAMFSGSGLKSIEIPEGVTGLYPGSFAHCDNLQSVSIPSSVTSISIGEFSAFRGSSVERFTVSEGNPMYTSIQGRLCSKDGKTLIFGNAAGNIPETVETIGEWSFCYFTNLKRIAIPPNITTIEKYAFIGCSSMKEVYIHDNVTKIGEGAFMDCMALQGITFPDTICQISALMVGHRDTSLEDMTDITITGICNTVYSPFYYDFKNDYTTYPTGWGGGKLLRFGDSTMFSNCEMKRENGYAYVDSFIFIFSKNAAGLWNGTLKDAVMLFIDDNKTQDELDEILTKIDIIANPRAPMRLGYTFMGWATEENGEPVFGAYQSESGFWCAISYAERRNLVSGTKYYAVWQKAE